MSENSIVHHRGDQLPATIEGLNEFIMIGKERLRVHQAKIRAIEKVGMAETARKAALQDGQDAATAVIYAEAKLGELLKAIPRQGNNLSSLGGTKPTLPSGVSKRTSHQAQTIAANPEKVEKIIAKAIQDEKIPTPDVVYKLIKKDEAQERVERIRKEKAGAVTGKYDVIILDPPWPMEKIERDCRPNQHAFDYPTMTEEELSCLDIPSSDDCHFFVWTTHKFLPMAFRLLAAWEARYVCTFVWHKPGGFQPIGLPQYNCEFALYARKGSPRFIDTKAFNTCFQAPRGAHSEKPEEFYSMIRRTTEGRRLDMFSRRNIEGFTPWGNEVDGLD